MLRSDLLEYSPHDKAGLTWIRTPPLRRSAANPGPDGTIYLQDILALLSSIRSCLGRTRASAWSHTRLPNYLPVGLDSGAHTYCVKVTTRSRFRSAEVPDVTGGRRCQGRDGKKDEMRNVSNNGRREKGRNVVSSNRKKDDMRNVVSNNRRKDDMRNVVSNNGRKEEMRNVDVQHSQWRVRARATAISRSVAHE
ncbi:hypothetical protein ElyMa_005776500 [Elysia marginata]|uniref:Uncharacterized protein n=1 Tax=Elysia marginata TaxID=1093978 RepID=A0AAV4FQF8_9GAST|nr:hypothetical protein ElyMa_005776500 [Elysia marginata]